MKISPVVLTMSCCLGLSATTSIASVDKLKPTYYEQERGLRLLIEKMNAEGCDYQITVEHKEFHDNFMGYHHAEGYVHRVTLPKEIAKQADAYDWRFRRGVFRKYLEDPEYSFYAGLLWITIAQKGNYTSRWGPGFVCFRLEPFEKRDKSLWVKDLQRYAVIWRSGNQTDPHGYREKILYDSISETYLKSIFPDRIYDFGASIVQKPVDIKGKPYEEGVEEFNASTNTGKLLELPLTQDNLGVWLYLVVSGPETKRPEIAKDFCTWCRRNSPKANPFLSAVMMGLFTVDGYSFDDEKGMYDPNERGKLLLDYIVEFPIPENATRLKIIMDGGNKEFVEDLMKKYGTAQGWQDLLKNPVEPKFVEYKQQGPRKGRPRSAVKRP